MSRLIAAGQTKLMLSELLEVAKKENFTVEDIIEHACVWVDNLPTAYDVEKVVEELEEAKEIVKEYEKYHYSIKLDKAIEIIRMGGVE